jgi:hypothetical protein
MLLFFISLFCFFPLTNEYNNVYCISLRSALDLCHLFLLWSVEPRFELGTTTVSEDAGIEPRTVAIFALVVSQTV